MKTWTCILALTTALILTSCNRTPSTPANPKTLAEFDAMSKSERQALYDRTPELYIEPLDGNGYVGRVFLADTHALHLVDLSGNRTSVPTDTICPRVLYGIRLAMMPRRDIIVAIEHARRGLLGDPQSVNASRDQLARIAEDHSVYKRLCQATIAHPRVTVRHPHVASAVREFARRAAEVLETRVTDDVHLVATDHFMIYTTGDPAQDAAIAQHGEKVYQYLLGQAELAIDTPVFPAPLAVFCLATPEQYEAFVRVAMPDDSVIFLVGANGFCAGDFGLSYLVLNGASMDDPQFTERLTHEITHAFNRQRLSDVLLPMWFDEGLAEATAADILPDSHAEQRYRDAIAWIRATDTAPAFNFDVFGGSDLDYGIAQAIVREMQSTPQGRTRMEAFFTRLKSGTDPHVAAESIYGHPLEDLLDATCRSIRR
jgi:hypothetical protein